MGEADGAIEVRRAQVADAEAVARLLDDFNSEFDDETPGVELMRERFAPLLQSGEIVVLVAGEGPDGFAQLRFRPSVITGALDAYLEELYVAPAVRGQGIGRALLEAAMKEARRLGAKRIELGTSEDDVAARGLYESIGFSNREGDPDGPVMLCYEREL